MKILEEIIKYIKNLLNRLRGGKPKRTPKEILKDHGGNVTVTKDSPSTIPSTPDLNTGEENKPPIEIPHEEFTGFVIDIKDETTRNNFIGKLKDLRDIKEFLQTTPLKWIEVRMDRIQAILNKMSTPVDFSDDELNFKIAQNVKAIAKNMLEILENIPTSNDLSEDARENLRELVENYLEKIGVDKEHLQAGDDFDDWAKLGMTDSSAFLKSDDPNLVGKIAEVKIQPRIIYYVGETGEVEKLIFGGFCKAYKG